MDLNSIDWWYFGHNMNENHTGLMIDTLKKIASFKERNQEGVFHRTMEAWIAFETLKKIGVYKDDE